MGRVFIVSFLVGIFLLLVFGTLLSKVVQVIYGIISLLVLGIFAAMVGAGSLPFQREVRSSTVRSK